MTLPPDSAPEAPTGWSVAGKTVLVTGATQGIGREAARELARRGARLVLVGRDPARTAATAAAIGAEIGSREVSFHLCDLSSQAEIRRLAAEVLARYERLDVLLNNAGAVFKRRQLTVDGIEATFAVNHLAYFLLTDLLRERLVASAPARVVSVASMGHRGGTLDFADLGYARGYSTLRAYRRSKLANVLFATELARRLAGTGVTSNSVHPGAVATNIWSGAPLWVKPLIRLFWSRSFLSPEEGALPLVHLAASPELEGVTGRYFEGGVESEPDPQAKDTGLAKRLWEESERLVGGQSAVQSVSG